MSTIFSAYDIRGRSGDTLTAEQSWNVGKAFAEWLQDEGPVVVAKTPTADLVTVHAVTEGLLLQGRDVIEGEGDALRVVDTITDKKAVGGVLVSRDDAENLEVIALYDASASNVTDKTGLVEIGDLVESGNLLPAAKKGGLKPLR